MHEAFIIRTLFYFGEMALEFAFLFTVKVNHVTLLVLLLFMVGLMRPHLQQF